MTATPTITLALPVYNGGSYLREALDSLLSQTYGDFELVISDNGSTDGTGDLCRRYASRDGRIRYFRQETNRGAAWNFNHCIEMARGRYVKWAAHDDLCAPQFLEHCVETLERAGRQTVLAYPRTLLIDQSGTLLGEHDNGLDLRDEAPHARLRHFVHRQNKANPIFGLIRSEALRRTRGLGRFPHADIVLLLELVLFGQFWEIDDHLFYRRVHPGNSCAAYRSMRDRAAWFDPHGSRRLSFFPLTRVFVESLRGIRRTPLPPAEKLRCFCEFTAAATRRAATKPTNYWRVNGVVLDY